MMSTAKGWIPNVPIDALSTVMFSPLAAHPVYRSESMLRAMQVMQQQQPLNLSTKTDDLVLYGATCAWPSSRALLEEEIPEDTHPVSLFQGFAATYPSLANNKVKQKKKSKKKKREQQWERKEEWEVPKTVEQMVEQREKKARESDRISMQKSSVVNEIEQLDFQVNELLMKRKNLEQKWEDLDTRDTELQLTIEGLDEAITDIERGGDGNLPIQTETESPMELYRRLFT
ncbi:hypothetical protein G6F56_011819 [Rhizopus delemar]|nr:hypothetical protein G6F56_011819 [Rhizopus delemar]